MAQVVYRRLAAGSSPGFRRNYATFPMSDTLLIDLHVQYIQNLGKVCGKLPSIIPIERAHSGFYRIRMT